MKNKFLPREFFITTGKGQSDTSEMNAFDNALIKAGIGQCNLVKVSSILPKNCEEISPVKIEPGTITFVVLSRSNGKKGEKISTGIGYAIMKNEQGYGIIAEDCNNKSEEKAREEIQKKLREMASSRKMEIERIRIETESLEVNSEFGCVIAALVYLFL